MKWVISTCSIHSIRRNKPPSSELHRQNSSVTVRQIVRWFAPSIDGLKLTRPENPFQNFATKGANHRRVGLDADPAVTQAIPSETVPIDDFPSPSQLFNLTHRESDSCQSAPNARRVQQTRRPLHRQRASAPTVRMMSAPLGSPSWRR